MINRLKIGLSFIFSLILCFPFVSLAMVRDLELAEIHNETNEIKNNEKETKDNQENKYKSNLEVKEFKFNSAKDWSIGLIVAKRDGELDIVLGDIAETFRYNGKETFNINDQVEILYSNNKKGINTIIDIKLTGTETKNINKGNAVDTGEGVESEVEDENAVSGVNNKNKEKNRGGKEKEKRVIINKIISLFKSIFNF